jgi:hypothetical protein
MMMMMMKAGAEQRCLPSFKLKAPQHKAMQSRAHAAMIDHPATTVLPASMPAHTLPEHPCMHLAPAISTKILHTNMR